MDVIEKHEAGRKDVPVHLEKPVERRPNPRCWPTRPHERRGDKLYCATCGRLIMTLHP